jgi:cellulose synthase operon protein C
MAAQGKTDRAIEEYRAILPLANEARPLLVRLLIQSNLRLPAERRSWEEIDNLIDAPDASEPTILRAEILVARDRPEEAQSLLESARDRHPDRVEPRLALSRLAARREQWEQALALLDDARRQLGDRAALRLERARIEVARGAGAALVIERQARDLDHFSPDERRMLLGGLATASFQVGATASAHRLWLTLAGHEPGERSVRLVLFDLAFQADDEAAMQRLLGDFRRIEGADGSFLRYAEARLLIWHAGRGDKAAPASARAILTTLAGRRPNWSLVPLAQAELDEIRGDREGAIKAYLRAIDLGERNPQVILHAARLQLAGRRYADADQLLRMLPEPQLLADNLFQLAADVAVQAANYSRALDLSRKGVAEHPDDYREHLGFGHALEAADRPAEAEAELRRAIALAGSVPDAWVALVGLLGRTGQPEKAEAVIRELERTLPAGQKDSILARCYDILGQLERAQTIYGSSDFPVGKNSVYKKA